MAKEVVMPALGMAQETGTLLQWLKAPGDSVTKGEPLMEVETDKATVEVEALASGILANVTAHPGDVVPVGQRIALILAPGEAASTLVGGRAQGPPQQGPPQQAMSAPSLRAAPGPEGASARGAVTLTATPVAVRIAAEHGLDLATIKPEGGKVQQEDVLAYLAGLIPSPGEKRRERGRGGEAGVGVRIPASPKARRLAQERGLDLRAIAGSGPDGAVLTADVEAFQLALATGRIAPVPEPTPTAAPDTLAVSRMWRIMVERVSQAWMTIPHFYLLKEANATRLLAWQVEAKQRATEKITVTDLLVKLAAAALRRYPRLNASWTDGSIVLNPDINIGLAVAVDEGLVVPVIHRADQLGLSQLAARRAEIVARAQAGKLSPGDISGGTFTISNLGMYGVDAFNAIVNPPQAAILAVSRIADRVVPLEGQPAVQPMLTLGLSCDHRVVDGARGAQFLQTLAELIEDPMRLLD